MKETLYLSYSPRLSGIASIVEKGLTNLGHHVEKANGTNYEGKLVLLLLDLDSSAEEIFSSAPFLKEQFDYSSFRAMRLMPFLVYHGNDGDIEEMVEGGLADTLEEVISGEFKPYGFDLDTENPLAEFESVLENYEE